MTRESLAYLAGWYEGEGWIGNPRPNTLSVRIGSTDEDVVRRAHADLGLGRIGR